MDDRQARHAPVGSTSEIHYSPAEDLERIDVTLLREAANLRC
jgi:hypothetical protein